MSLLADIRGALTARQRRQLLSLQAVSLLMAFSTVTGIAAIAPFFALLGDPGLIQRNAALHWMYVHGAFSSSDALVALLGVGFVAVVLLANLINVLGFLVMNRTVLRIGSELQTTLFAEYLSRPYAFHAATNSATLFTNVIYETTRFTHGVLQSLFVLVTNLVTASLIVLSMLFMRPTAAIAMIAGLAGGYLLIYLLVRRRLLRIGQSQSRFAAEQAQIVSESFGGIKEIILLQARGFFRNRFEHASYGVLRAAAHHQLVGTSPRYLMECVAAAGLVGVALLLRGRDAGVGPWLGPLTFLAFAAYRLLATLQQVFSATVRLRADCPALAAIAADLQRARAAQPPGGDSGGPRIDQAWNERPRSGVELKEVSFQHGPGQPYALREVSLTVPARAVIGIVGANGAGKSTLIDVIAGLLTPTAGLVEIDGHALDDRNRAAWQSRIAYLPQNVFLLDSSIAANIAFGIPPAAIDLQRLQYAAQLAQLEEFVLCLPEGYGQRVGERGVALSGGQRQRIGIARALYRDASVLLLDELTSALDGPTEQDLVNTLGQLRNRYTILVVAHRMSTVRACDLIFHLHGGRIVASGTYDGLLQSSEGFRRMAGVR